MTTKTSYVTKIDSGVKGRVYVTGFGINILIPESDLEEMKSRGFVEGYTKPYLHFKDNKKED